MSLIKYTVFESVAELKSFTKAAEYLMMTQSAVSRSIKSLEEEFGSPLFIRKKNGVELNHYGEVVLPKIQAVLTANRHLENLMTESNNLHQGKIVIGSFSSASTLLLPGMIAKFSKQFPNIQMEVKEGHYDDIQSWLNQGIVDVALLIEEFIEKDYVKHHLFTDSIKIIAPKALNLIKEQPVAISIIEDHHFIVTEHYPNPYLTQLLDKYHLKPNTKYVVKTNQSVFAFVEKGLGIALLPESTVLGSSLSFDVIDLKETIQRKVHLVTKKPNLKIPLIKRFWVSCITEEGSLYDI